MDTQPAQRIIVLARPELAREVEATLRGAGHEVYRTPDAAGVLALVARIRPHLVIIAQDLPWADATEPPFRVARDMNRTPVLLIDTVNGDGAASGIPWLPSPVDHAALQQMVARLLQPSPALQVG
ncbi:MAG: hypothetical protein R2853_15460 [Thermomicrobiales bacterium]|nr:hypothetical protein [Thermomicrobiales bacterium]